MTVGRNDVLVDALEVVLDSGLLIVVLDDLLDGTLGPIKLKALEEEGIGVTWTIPEEVLLGIEGVLLILFLFGVDVLEDATYILDARLTLHER